MDEKSFTLEQLKALSYGKYSFVKCLKEVLPEDRKVTLNSTPKVIEEGDYCEAVGLIDNGVISSVINAAHLFNIADSESWDSERNDPEAYKALEMLQNRLYIYIGSEIVRAFQVKELVFTWVPSKEEDSK